MHSTWNADPSARSLRPTTSATRPPMPASTSSKIRPGRRRARRPIGGVAEPVPRRRGQRLDGEHDARQLAAGHDPRQRAEVLAGVWRHEELRRVDAARGPGRLRHRRRRSAPRSACAPSPAPRAALRGAAPSAWRCGAAPPDSAPAAARKAARAAATPRSSSAMRSSPRSRSVSSRRRRVAARDDVGQRRPVFPLQPLEQRQAFLELLELRRRRLDAVAHSLRRNAARSSSCDLIPSRASRYGLNCGSSAASSATRRQTPPSAARIASSLSYSEA